jgi:hypothetical protein
MLYVVVIVLVLAGLAVYHFGTRHFGKWEKKFGVKGLKPVPFFGNEKDFLLGTKVEHTLTIKASKQCLKLQHVIAI